MATPAGEEILKFAQGQMLFQQGDVGGDLYIIQEGEVEIFSVQGAEEVRLTIMKTGEIIGLLSCMTRDPRMASARALTHATVRKIRYESVTSLVRSLPTWMKTVLREFGIRLSHMNKMYSDCVGRIKYLKAHQISRLYTGAQIASAIAVGAEFKKIKIDEVPSLIPDDILTLVEGLLGRPREEIDEIFDVFVDAGMIKLNIEQDKKRKYFTVANAGKLKGFGEFVAQAGRGKTRKLLQTSFAHKEHRVLGGIVRYAVAMKLSLQSSVQVCFKDLEASMQSITGQAFSADALMQAAKLELVKIEGEAPEEKVVFVPAVLSATLTHFAAYRKLEKLDEIALTQRK